MHGCLRATGEKIFQKICLGAMIETHKFLMKKIRTDFYFYFTAFYFSYENYIKLNFPKMV